MKQQKTAKDGIILWAVFLIPVVWAALIVAPCLGGNLADILSKVSVAMAQPLNITWCDNSARCLAIFIGAYIVGAMIYYGTKPKLRQGEEHGSARWGTPRQVNEQLSQKDSFPLTRHVRIGMDTHKHRRNLNILALGGSGAGKTRSLALPGIMECNCSFVVTDPKGEILQNVGHLLRENGYSNGYFSISFELDV